MTAIGSLPPKKQVTLVTRGSPLALWQADFVTRLLAERGVHAERLIVKTTADRVQDRFLHEMGGKGLFVKELEEALLDGRADLAVHSLKDMPAVVPEPFSLAAVLRRHACTDLMIFREDIGRKLNPPAVLSAADAKALGPLVVGTGSLRRQALFKRYAPELVTQGVRGNVDTRLRKLDEGQWDALVLAEASLDRLNLKPGRIVSRLASDWFIPCAAQGALAIEARGNDPFGSWLGTLGDSATTLAVNIERGVLARLGGDCTLPFGCLVRVDGDQILGEAAVFTREGDAAIASYKNTLNESHAVVKETFISALTSGLKSQGAARILSHLGLDVPASLR
jgi:hydroxymethylbilane synthase